MPSSQTTACPGCGLVLPANQIPPPDRLLASGECYELYHELSFYTLAHGDLPFLHQHAVDTYAAQHAGLNTKPITTVFSLIGLALLVEHGYSGRQVQQAHLRLSAQRKAWPVLPSPP